MGISGRIASRFLTTEITPLLALIGLLLGVFAVWVTPREEEPQIDVTFANVFVPYPGASASEVEHLVSIPAEQVLSEISGVEHIYSVSRPGMSVITVQFKVGEKRTEAIVRLYSKVFSNRDWLPAHLGVSQPIVKPKGIDDVPIVTLTLWTEDQKKAAHELIQVAHAIEVELKRVPGTRQIFTVGGPERVVHVLLDPQRLSAYNIAIDDLRRSLNQANRAQEAGSIVQNNSVATVKAGQFLISAEEVSSLVVGVHDGRPVYLHDVAEVNLGPDYPESSVWHAGDTDGETGALNVKYPAVTIAIAKKPGTNAVQTANELISRFDALRGSIIPDGVKVSVTRNYGETANQKATTLITKLVFATLVVIVLVMVALGFFEAIVVGVAVVITLAITLFASWAWGFTLNRVSLFALIFSIGILVDDAIVVVENIHRRLKQGIKNIADSIPQAVDEVGGPTILATLTVIAALLPMAFVSGLMGPYMSPIPINASMGMLISLIVAFVVTPWLSAKILVRRFVAASEGSTGSHFTSIYNSQFYLSYVRPLTKYGLDGFFRKSLNPFLDQEKGRRARWGLLIVIVVSIFLSLSLAGFNFVVLKMLPFDNKSEFQVIVDMPEGTPVEQTARVLDDLATQIAKVPEVKNYQSYVGVAAPINFNGLVRQYYLRRGPNVGDIQVNLTDKAVRSRQSHEIASAIRNELIEVGKQFDANVKVVEVPPGPPVMSPLVAEIYGPDYPAQMAVAKQVRKLFENTQNIVDVDDSTESSAPRYVLKLDRQKAALLGLSQEQMVSAITTVMGDNDIGYLHGPNIKYAIPIRAEFRMADQADIKRILALKVRSTNGSLIPLSEVVNIEITTYEKSIYHKDLLPVVFVTADVAGKTDSPLYGMFDIYNQLKKLPTGESQIASQYFVNLPDTNNSYTLKWDGEWKITYETFRDMGIAYAVGMILIYLLVVAQFRSYLVPLVIMAPIPLTIIGVMPGHALLGAQFTATSMIGMIALAGIIVRNSILLVDFINDELRRGQELTEAVINAAAVRTRPIVLTALAAMLGATFILDDPIFRGLAISLIFGILVSTLLTLFIIPILYYSLRRRYPLAS